MQRGSRIPADGACTTVNRNKTGTGTLPGPHLRECRIERGSSRDLDLTSMIILERKRVKLKTSKMQSIRRNKIFVSGQAVSSTFVRFQWGNGSHCRECLNKPTIPRRPHGAGGLRRESGGQVRADCGDDSWLHSAFAKTKENRVRLAS